MPVDSDGRWHPRTFPKQDYIRQVCRQKKFVLVNGPRYSGKSVGNYHAVVEHAWRVRFANIAVITISQTVGVDSGVWNDLTKIIIPEWISGDFGMKWVEEPYLTAMKKPCCEVSNQWGESSTITLESLTNEAEAEDRFKPRRYTMIYVPELSSFRERETFVTWTECLRMIGVSEEEHSFLADSNPPDASCWWMHDIWWDMLEADESDLNPIDVPFKRQLARIDIMVPDNIFAHPDHISLLQAKYRHNDDLYKRYILGLPVQTTENSLFARQFRPSFHVIGNPLPNSKTQEFDMLVPHDGCTELFTGWDPGTNTNSAAVIADKDWTEDQGRRLPVFNFVDELAVIGTPHSLEEFVIAVMRKMQFWEMFIGRPGKVRWTHWSDRSVFDMRSPESHRYYHEIIYDISVAAIEEGLIQITSPIILQAAERGPRTLSPRVDLWAKLLFDDRLFFSAAKCPHLIAMCKGIQRSPSNLGDINKGDRHKHIFDAGSYLVSSECYDEMNRTLIHRISKQSRKTTLVSV